MVPVAVGQLFPVVPGLSRSERTRNPENICGMQIKR
jgi:hypothetical protein